MHQIGQIKIYPLPFQRPDTNEPCLLSKADHITLMEVRAGSVEDLVLHHQTIQLLATKGNLVVVILQNQQYDYIVLSDQQPALVEIPPHMPYGLLNLNDVSCFLLCNGQRYLLAPDQDYYVLKPPFCYDIARVIQLLQKTDNSQGYRPMLRAL